MNRAMLLPILLAFGCQSDPRPARETLDREALKAEIKAELKAEILSELRQTSQRGRHDRPISPPAVPNDGRPDGAGNPAPAVSGVEPPAPDSWPEPTPEPTPDQAPTAERVAPPEPVVEQPITQPNVPEPTQPEPVEPANPVASNLEIVQLVVSHGIDREQRKPLGAGTSFSVTPNLKLYAYMVIKNLGADTEATVEWRHAGRVRSTVKLKAGHSIRGWRTWSTIRIGPEDIGEWQVQIRDPDGRGIGRKSFRVTR